MESPIETLRDAAYRGDVGLVRMLLLQGVNVNAPLPNGDRVLVGVAGMGDARLDITKLLVENGADVNSPTGNITLLKRIQGEGYCDNEATIAFFKSKGARAADL
jgi:hypothetical protein